jgi:hypothetical protein
MEWREASNDQIDQALIEFAGLSSAGQARTCDLIAEVDVRQSWMADGARSLSDWVTARLGVRQSTAAQLVAVARRLVDLPLLRDRFRNGELSLDQVDAISRVATPDDEETLIGQALGLSAAALDRLARRDRGISEEEARTVWERSQLVRQWNLDESELCFRGRLPGVEGRIFDQAIDSRVDQMSPDAETGMFDLYEHRAADALVELAASGGNVETTPAEVAVFADLDALTTTDQGTAHLDNTAPIPNTTAQRLGCDGTIQTIIRDGTQIIGVGRRTRQIPRRLRRLVIERDGGVCQHPGCNNTRWLQVHHIVPWALGGPTDLDNLILICGTHHRFVHEAGWHITGPPDKRVFRRPDWTPYPKPRPPITGRLAQLVQT